MIVGFDNYCFTAPKLCQTQFLFSKNKIQGSCSTADFHTKQPHPSTALLTQSKSFTLTTQRGMTFTRPLHKHTHLTPVQSTDCYSVCMSPHLVLPLEADPSLYPKRPEHHPKARLSHKAGSLPMKQVGTSECSESAGPRGLCQATDPIWVQLGPAPRGSTTQRTRYRPVSKARLEPPTPADLPAAEAGKASVPTAAEPTLLP